MTKCLSCVESSRESVYKDDTVKTLWQKFLSILPSSSKISVVLNTVTLGSVVYSLKLLHDEESVIDDILANVIGSYPNSTLV